MENEKPTRVLVVDDDAELRKLLTHYLGTQGLEIKTLPDGRDIDRRLERDRPDLMVLDLMMPGEGGLAVCRRLRGRGEDIPIIMLTAKNEDIDRIIGLEIGADDYLGKPFNPRELVARIHTVLRRRSSPPPGVPDAQATPLQLGDWQFDPAARALVRGAERVALSTGEYALLAAFARYPHHTLSRERLLELARGRDNDMTERAVDVQVSRLRKIVEPDPSQPRYIQTVWARGYVLVPDGGAA